MTKDYMDFFGVSSPLRRVSNQEMDDLGWSIKRKIKKQVRRITHHVPSPVRKVVAPMIAPAVVAVKKVSSVASPFVNPVVQRLRNQVNSQINRTEEIAKRYGIEKLKELRAKAIEAAKNPAVQNAAIIAAASALGQPEVGQRLAQINIDAQNAYHEYSDMIEYDQTARAIAQYNANPGSVAAANIISQAGIDSDTAAFVSAYNNQLDSRATQIALRSSGISESTSLNFSSPMVIGGLIAGGALLFLFVGKK